MARGARQTLLNTAQGGYNGAQQFNTQLEGSNAAIQNSLIPAYQQLINNPGPSAAEKAATTLSTEGAAASSFGAAGDAATRAAARTGNAAALTPALDKLAQQKASTMSDVAAKNELTFENLKRQDQQRGLQGMSSLYGMDTNLLARSLGIPVEYLNTYSSQAKGQTPSVGWSWQNGLSVAA